MEIKKSLNRFLSIFFIVAMGVAFFSGIQAAAPDMRYTGDYYFDDSRLMDLRVISTLGLTEDDLKAIGDVEGVQAVEGCRMEDVYCGEGDARTVIHMESISDSMNILTPEKGSLPEKAGECFLDASYALKCGYEPGDTLEITVESEDDSTLVRRKFTVSGYGYSPCYISFERGSTTLGTGSLSGFAYVLPQEFDTDVYSVVYVHAKGARELTAYTDEYDDLVERVSDRLEEISDVRCEIRYDEVMEEARDAVDEGKQEVEDGKKELEEAKQELSDGEAEAESELAEAESELLDGESQLEEGKQELEDARQELAEGEKEVSDGQDEIDDNARTLEDGRRQIEEARNKLNSGEKEYQSGLKQYNSETPAARKKLKAAQKELDQGKTKLEAGWKEYNTSLASIEEGEKQITAAEAELASSQASYEAGLSSLEAGKAQYEEAAKQLPTLQAAYDSANTQVQQLQASCSQAETMVQQLQADYDSEAGKAAAFRQEQAAAAGRVSEYENQISARAGEKAGAETELGQKQTELAGWQAVSGSDEASEEEKAAAQENITRLTGEISQLNGRISSLGEEITALNESVKSEQSSSDLAKGQAEALEAGLPARQQTLEEAKISLAQAEAGLTTAKESAAELKQGIDGLAATKQTLEATEQQLATARIQITQGQKQLEAKKAELASGREALASAKKELEASEKKLKDGQKEIDDGYKELEKAKTKLNNARKELDLGWAKLKASQEQLAEGERQLQEGRDQLAKARQELVDARKQIADGEKEIEENEQKLKDGWEEYLDGKEEARKEIREGKQKIADAEKELKDAEKKISDAEKDLLELKMPKWYVGDRSVLPENSGMGENADRISNLAKVFPALFLLVAALISLTTMTRMVEEERTQIGTLKALGYSKWSIASKYLKYAFFATVGGSFFGILFGEKVFPWVIINGYSIIYQHLPVYILNYNWQYGLTASGIALACTLGATLSACYRELQAVPAQLMRPPSPKNGKRVFLEYLPFLWKRLSFTWKSTVRNLMRYKKRFLMTVIGIGGCMGLLLVGYGLRDSIMDIGTLQFEELQLYDAAVVLDVDADQEKLDEVSASLEQDPRVAESGSCLMQREEVENQGDSGKKWYIYVYVQENTEQIDDYFCFRDRETKETYRLTDEGAIITEKIAREFDIQAGDTITLKQEGKEDVTIPVQAVCENYLSHYLYLTPALYEKVYGEQPEYNSILFRSSEDQDVIEEIGGGLLKHDAVLNITYTRTMAGQIENMLGALNLVIVVLIISAGMLAFVVLYNLNNININERKRELATLKVLGFYDGDVAAYVYRENILLTVMGSALGVFLGKLLHSFIITTVEVESCMFGRTIKLPSFLYGILFTCIFSLIVNFVMYFKLKKIDMVESLKSIE